MDATQVYQQVQTHYGSCARESSTNGSSHSQQVAKAFGYSEDELLGLPEGANLGLSCGNPLAVAGLKSGETVVDLGSGAGFDVFLAGKKVGERGKAIGVDMTKAMLERARHNKEKSGAENTSFIESPITNIALPSATVDCIISNCVVNLVPEAEKQLVFDEMFRLLKPGGRVAITDILAKKDLPLEMKRDMGLYVGCIAGASEVGQYEEYLRVAGFKGMMPSPRARAQWLMDLFLDTLIIDSKNDLNVYKGVGADGAEVACCGTKAPALEQAPSCCGTKAPSKKQASSCGVKLAPQSESKGTCCSTEPEQGDDPSILSAKYTDMDFNEWVGSFQVYAVKPGSHSAV
ncbi:hypothetical protein MMC30_006659 [Trapelia coarctata]|nr:hypothetical protein [Trapelia coarctata]